MSNIRRIVACAMSLFLLFSIMPAEPLFASEVNMISAEEESNAQTSEEELKLAEDVVYLNYLLLEKDVVATPGEQMVVTSIGDETTTLSNAVLAYKNQASGQAYQVTAFAIEGDAAAFRIEHGNASEVGVYELDSIAYTLNDVEYSIRLADVDIYAIYGVNREVETEEDITLAELLEEVGPEVSVDVLEKVSKEELEEIKSSVVSYDADGVQESELSISDVLENGDDAMTDTLSRAIPTPSAPTLAMPSVTPIVAGIVPIVASSVRNLVVVLDPGHCDRHPGAFYHGIREEERNLKIAQACRDELERYAGVTVHMTRNSGACPSGSAATSSACLSNRVPFASSVGANVLVSFHLNANVNTAVRGVGIYIPNNNYRPGLASEARGLANEILANLQALGLPRWGGGLFTWNSENNTTYPDGSLADYLAIIRQSKLANITPVLIEHAFLSNAGDVATFISSDAMIKRMGVADATAIAKYYKLSLKSNVPPYTPPPSSAAPVPKPTDVNQLSLSKRTHVQDIGWLPNVSEGRVSGTSGRSLRVESFGLSLVGAPAGAGIEYSAHVQDIGWQATVSNGALAGTSGQSKRVEAIRINLRGMPSGWNVFYRTHVQNVGWTNWSSNGEVSGTTGRALRVEAFQVIVCQGGLTTSLQRWTDDNIRTANPSLSYISHVQNVGWQARVTDGHLSGTSGRSLRVEAFDIALVNAPSGAAIDYSAHVQELGWQANVSNGTIAGTIGQARRVEAIRISLRGMPGWNVYYRTHVQNVGWTGWSSNGAVSGTTGRGLRIEAMQVIVCHGPLDLSKVR